MNSFNDDIRFLRPIVGGSIFFQLLVAEHKMCQFYSPALNKLRDFVTYYFNGPTLLSGFDIKKNKKNTP